MKIGIASDHRGVQLKARLTQLLQSLECEVKDFGPFEVQSVDYPDYAAQVAREVSGGKIDRGILICGTGIGMCNKILTFVAPLNFANPKYTEI